MCDPNAVANKIQGVNAHVLINVGGSCKEPQSSQAPESQGGNIIPPFVLGEGRKQL